MDEFVVNYFLNGVILFYGFVMYGMLFFLFKNYYLFRIIINLLNWKYFESKEYLWFVLYC